MEADRNDRFADRTFNFNDALYCLRVRVKQPFIFTTWTSHMHFLHFFSPPARGQPKGNVKLTVGDCFIFLCTVCRDLNPIVAINIVYRTYVLLSINFAFQENPGEVFILLEYPVKATPMNVCGFYFFILSFASIISFRIFFSCYNQQTFKMFLLNTTNIENPAFLEQLYLIYFYFPCHYSVQLGQ